VSLGLLRLGLFGWQHRSLLTKLLLGLLVAVVVVPMSLAVLVVAALSGPAQAAMAVGGAVRPMASWVVSQPFGCTGFYIEPPLGGCAHFHSGIDLVAPSGSDVRAVMAGVVEISPIGGYGLHVILHHGGDLVTLYAHLAGFAVVPGQVVAPGALLGYEGSTGASTGAHLHFEVRRGTVPVDPVQVFPGLFAAGRSALQAAGTPPAA
jgi:murein DD-endopeptidase MepM/ murein hydrolase activator NlpD